MQFTLFEWFLLLTVVGCLCLTAKCYAMIRVSHRHRNLETRLGSVETEMLDVLDKLDKLHVLTKRKYARDVARQNRAKRVDGIPDPKEDPDGWKREMAKRHALGEKVI